MSRNEHLILDDLQHALKRLSNGRTQRNELFQEERQGFSGKPNAVLRRLCAEELLIRTGAGNIFWYEAVDPFYLVKLAEDKVLLSKWLFNGKTTFEELTAPPPASDLLLPAIEFPFPPPPPVPPPPPPLVVDGSVVTLLEQLLNTVVSLAENLVYVKEQVDRISRKFSVLFVAPSSSTETERAAEHARVTAILYGKSTEEAEHDAVAKGKLLANRLAPSLFFPKDPGICLACGTALTEENILRLPNGVTKHVGCPAQTKLKEVLDEICKKENGGDE